MFYSDLPKKILYLEKIVFFKKMFECYLTFVKSQTNNDINEINITQ